MKIIFTIVAMVAVLISPPAFGTAIFNLPLAYSRVESSAQVDLLSVAGAKDKPWALIEVQPDRLSGVGVLSNLNVNPVTQTCNVFGTYEIVSQLGADIAQSAGTYSWPALFSFGSDRDEIAIERYGEFSNTFGNKPRYFLCQLNKGAQGNSLFTTVTLVPDEWVASVEPAVKFIRTHPLLQTAYGSSVRNNQVAALLKDKNPYIVLTAAQILTSEGTFSTEDMDTVLQSGDTVLIGAVAADANIGYFQGALGTVGCIAQTSVQTNSIGQLEGVVLGITLAPRLFSAVTMYKGKQPLTTVGSHFDKRYDALSSFTHQTFVSSSDRLSKLNLPADPRTDTIHKFCLYFGGIKQQ